jgi:hypothetical protein
MTVCRWYQDIVPLSVCVSHFLVMLQQDAGTQVRRAVMCVVSSFGTCKFATKHLSETTNARRKQQSFVENDKRWSETTKPCLKGQRIVGKFILS